MPDLWHVKFGLDTRPKLVARASHAWQGVHDHKVTLGRHGVLRSILACRHHSTFSSAFISTNMRIPSLRLQPARARYFTCQAHQRTGIRLISSRASPIAYRRRLNSTLAVERSSAVEDCLALHTKPSHQPSPFASQGGE